MKKPTRIRKTRSRLVAASLLSVCALSWPAHSSYEARIILEASISNSSASPTENLSSPSWVTTWPLVINSGELTEFVLETNSSSPVVYSIESGSLPPGIVLDGNVLSGTASNVASLTHYDFVVRAEDQGGKFTDSSARITVEPVAAPLVVAQPALNYNFLPTYATKSFSVNLPSTGGDGPVVWSLRNAEPSDWHYTYTKPFNCTFNGGRSQHDTFPTAISFAVASDGTVTGEFPTSQDLDRTCVVYLSATDGVDTVKTSAVITIAGNQRPYVIPHGTANAHQLYSVVRGSSYSFSFDVIDPEGDPFTVVAPSQAAGMPTAVTDTGEDGSATIVLSGTVSKTWSVGGNFFSVGGTDADGRTTYGNTGTFDYYVMADPRYPEWTSTELSPLPGYESPKEQRYTRLALPAVSYNHNGTVSVVSTTLPPASYNVSSMHIAQPYLGLYVSTPGSYSITLKITDDRGQSRNRTFAIVVASSGITVDWGALASVSASETVTLPIVVNGGEFTSCREDEGSIVGPYVSSIYAYHSGSQCMLYISGASPGSYGIDVEIQVDGYTFTHTYTFTVEDTSSGDDVIALGSLQTMTSTHLPIDVGVDGDVVYCSGWSTGEELGDWDVSASEGQCWLYLWDSPPGEYTIEIEAETQDDLYYRTYSFTIE